MAFAKLCNIWSILLFAILCSGNTYGQVPAAQTSQSNPCSQKTTCHECIETPSCAWCYDPNFQEHNRCFQPSIPGSLVCAEEYTYNPDNIQQVFLNKPLSRPLSGVGIQSSYHEQQSGFESSSSKGHGSGAAEIIQIQPQHLKLQLRPHQTFSVWMNYTKAEGYPVDLYYLMDLSKSMEDDKDKLSLLGDLLAETMQNITSNFRLGFGSFVDKVVMPYVSTVPKKLMKPCGNCEPPYGYRNHMALSTNTSHFSHMVKAASVSGNLDAPEGGFDAIMQAVVCNEQIGWRTQARRLLVFSTDAGFHYAGDGKLGGIVKPNDGRCHLDRTGFYTHSSLQDYPSISQLNLKVKENAINLIFAVTADQISVYEQLKQHVEGASSGQLSTDSSNIVELIQEQYQVGDIIKFRVDIEALACPKDPKQWKQSMKVYPVGVGVNESLIIDLELLCACPCEIPGDKYYKVNTAECSYHGIYKCGVCECDPSYFGRKCECSASEQNFGLFNMTCRPDNTSTVDCSGRGSCVCGLCECNVRSEEEQIYGQFCECDNFSCERHEGLLCSGPDHGVCDCGVCKCKEGWTGTNCACQVSTDTCYLPGGDGQICSGHGVCECGVCKCDSTEDGGRYSGKYCDKCPTCPNRCLEYKDCVQCQMYGTGKLNQSECLANCTKFVPTPVDVVEANEDNDENLCAYYDEDDCRFAYVYYYDKHEEKVAIKAQQQRECPPKVYLLGIVLGVIAAIVLMGLAILLLWKLLTTIHDRREFAKFEKERMMAKWDTGENPIYKQATSTFKNPTYAGKS